MATSPQIGLLAGSVLLVAIAYLGWWEGGKWGGKPQHSNMGESFGRTLASARARSESQPQLFRVKNAKQDTGSEEPHISQKIKKWRNQNWCVLCFWYCSSASVKYPCIIFCPRLL